MAASVSTRATAPGLNSQASTARTCHEKLSSLYGLFIEKVYPTACIYSLLTLIGTSVIHHLSRGTLADKTLVIKRISRITVVALFALRVFYWLAGFEKQYEKEKAVEQIYLNLTKGDNPDPVQNAKHNLRLKGMIVFNPFYTHPSQLELLLKRHPELCTPVCRAELASILFQKEELEILVKNGLSIFAFKEDATLLTECIDKEYYLHFIFSNMLFFSPDPLATLEFLKSRGFTPANLESVPVKGLPAIERSTSFITRTSPSRTSDQMLQDRYRALFIKAFDISNLKKMGFPPSSIQNAEEKRKAAFAWLEKEGFINPTSRRILEEAYVEIDGVWERKPEDLSQEAPLSQGVPHFDFERDRSCGILKERS